VKINDFLKKIDAMEIYEKDYETIQNLLNNVDDRLFVKIIEEVINGNLFFSDFERVFQDTKYVDILKANFESQQKLSTELSRLIDFRKNILGEKYYYNDASNTKIGIPLQPKDGKYSDFYQTISDETLSELYYQLFDVMENDNDIVRASKIRIYETLFQNQQFNKDDLLFFASSYIIPLSYENQTLNGSDITFMTENNLTEDQVKKIKTLSLFLKRDNI